MSATVSLAINRHRVAYWRAERALAHSMFKAGRVTERFFLSRCLCADHASLGRPPFSHHFRGSKSYDHH